MNLKKTVLSVMAAGAILASGFGGAMAQSSSAGTTGTVNVTSAGNFDVQFCSAVTFTDVTLTSVNASSATSTASVFICYTDTQPHRGVFRTYLQAGNFNGNGFNIPAANLSPSYMYNPGQGQWGPGVGGIGAMKGNANYGGGPGGYVSGVASEGPWVGGNLATAQYVGYGNAGIGTAGTMYQAITLGDRPQLNVGSVAKIDLALQIPSNTPTGTFVSQFTVNVNPVAP